MLVGCFCMGIGEALVGLYLAGSLLIGWLGGRVWRRRRPKLTPQQVKRLRAQQRLNRRTRKNLRGAP